MAIQTATNPQTGERVALVGDEWQPIAQTATNKAGVKAYLVGNQWIVDDTPVAKTAPKTAEPEAEYDFGDAMGTGASEIMAAVTPKKKSVLEGAELPAPLPTEDKYVVRPEFINAVQAKLNAAPAETRTAVLAEMVKRPDVYGRAARAIAGRYEAQNKVVAPTLTKATDLRLEQQTQRFIDQGLNPEVAEGIARNQALSGQIRPDLDQMRETPEEVQAGQELAYDPKLHGIDATIQAVQRVGWKTAVALGQAGGGMQVFAGDLLGLDTSDKRDTLKKMSSFTESMGDPALKPLSILESAVTSIGQQLPAMVFGVATGSEPLVLASMFANSFGQNYEEGRRSKLNVADSTARAAANAALEVLGEKFGLKQNINAIKTAMKGVPSDQLANFIAITLKKEVPGELLTYAGQYAVDMGYGMKPEASIQNFVQGAIDTMLTTVAQGGIMAGGRKAISAVAGRGGAKPEIAQSETIKSAENLAKSEGFLAPAATPTKERVEPTFDEAAFMEQPTAAAPAPAVEPTAEVKAIADRLQKRGISRKTALAMAEREVGKTIQPKEAKPKEAKAIESRVKAITQDLIDAGVPPQQAAIDAQRLAKEEVEADELAQTEAGGVANVARPISEPSGEGVSVAGQPSAKPPAGRVAGAEPSGVVPTGQAVAGTPAGETVKPTALEEKADEGWKDLGQVQRYEEPGVGRATTDKPHGIYTTPANVESPHKDLGGERSTWDVNQDANVLDVTPLAGPDVAMRKSAVGAGAGVAAAKKLLGAEHFEILRRMSKEELIAAANAQFPNVDFSKYYDAQEVMEALGAQLAKQAGYDAIWQADKDPAFSEFVALTDNAMTPTETKGTTSGTKTSQAKQATQEGQEAPAAGAVAKGKRGPKPKPAEVKAQIKVSRNEQNRINNYAEDKRKKFVAQLQQTLTPEQIEELSFEEAEQAEIDARQSRRSALRGLIELQDNPKIARGSAVGKRISAAIKDSKATEAEIADIRRGIKAAQDVLTGPKEDVLGSAATRASEAVVAGRPTAMRSSEAKVDKPDAGFNKVTNGAQAITQVIKTGNAFQKLVAQRIRNYMSGVKFVVVEKGDTIPEQLHNARGLFEYTPETGERTIYVRGSSFGNMQGINNVTVLHELLHAATASRIAAGAKEGAKNPQLQKFVGEIQSLMNRAREAYEEGVLFRELPPEIQRMIESKVDIDEETGKPTFVLFDNPNEFLAYGMSSPTFQKFLMQIEGTQKEESAFSKFVRAILDLFGLGNGNFTALSDLVNITDKMLEAEVTTPSTAPQAFQQTQDERTQKEKEKAVNHAIKVVERSFEAEEISEQAEVLQRLRNLDTVPLLQEAAEGLSYVQKQAIAKMLSTPLIAEIGGINVPELINTNRLLEQLDGAKAQMIKAGAKTIDDIKRLIPTEQSRKKVSYAAHVFTVSKIDPRVDKSVAKLNTIYNALTPEEKQALDEIASVYSDFADHLDFILEENAKALRPGEAQKLIEAVREVLGKDNRIPFYVTLARDQDGKFWLRAGPGEFYTRKTLRERNRLAKAIAKERNTTMRQLIADKEIELGDDIDTLRKKVLDSSDALRKLFIMIDDADFTAEEQGASLQKAKDGMKDSVFQLWLHMQPESSARKQFIHRSALPPAGFRTDVLQNLAESVLKFSNHAARLEYAPQLRKSVSQAHASIAERSEYTPYVAEMALRVNDTLAPTKESGPMAAARFANSFTFGYYMSESTAVLQLLSVYQVGTAQLVKHYPVAAVAKEMKTMGALWNTMGIKNEHGEWVMPTIEKALNIKDLPSDTPAERLRKEQDRAFIDAMNELNASESTGVRDLMGYKDMPTEKYGSKYEQAKRIGRFVVGGLIHTTERMSRELMFMSSAHLARDKAVAEFRKSAEYAAAPDKIAAERAFGEANMQKWADRAAKDTNLALFNYSESAKPRYMRNALGKVSLQFFTYQLNVGSFLLRNLLGMIKPLPGETRTECLRAFATLMGTTWTLGGVSATFGVPIVFGFVSAIMKALKDKDEPDELRDIDNLEAYKVWLYNELGDVTIGGESLAQIIDQGPVNAFTGLDVSSRTSLSNILTPPEVKASRTYREGVLGYAQIVGGPNLQAVLAVADGADLMIKGEYFRGAEKMMPWAAVRNKMTVYRLKTEGEKGLKLGDDIIESEMFYAGELLGQAVGMRPVLLSDVASANRKAREVVGKVVDQRAALLDQIDRADRKGDIDASIAAREAKNKFNIKYSELFPKLIISNEDVVSFKEGRNKARSRSIGGFELTPQNRIVAEQVIDRSREALIKREKEVAERKKVELSGMAK